MRWLLFLFLVLAPSGLYCLEDLKVLNRRLDQQTKLLKRKGFKAIESQLGLTPDDPDQFTITFKTLPPKLAQERKINGSDLIDLGQGSFEIVIYREFARAGLINVQAEVTYQLARAVWRSNYPKRSKVAAWFLHGMALHASGMGNDRILFIIADNEDKTTEIADGWESDRRHNFRDHADDILIFRFIEKEQGPKGLKSFIQRVAQGEQPHRVLGDPYPGGFRNLEIKWRAQAKEVIEDLSARGLEEFNELYEKYQEAKTKERAKMTGLFVRLLSRHRNTVWEGKARYYLGRCWLEADREDKALAQFQKVLGDLAWKSDPRFLDMAKYRLAQAYLERNKVSRAIRGFQEYLRDFVFGKYLAKSHYALAQIYHAKRQDKKARTHLEWILNQQDDASTIKKAKRLLKKLR